MCDKNTTSALRSRIPEIIHRAGYECEVVVMSEDEYRQALLKKMELNAPQF